MRRVWFGFLAIVAVVVVGVTIAKVDLRLARATDGRQQQTYQEQLAAYQRQLEETEVQLAKVAEQQKRYDKILATWEAQQQQFQKYLDTLKSK